MPYEILALLAGVALVSAFWRTPGSLLRVSGYAALFLAVLLVALALSGWPLFRVRLHQRPMSQATEQSLQRSHSVGGHLSLWPVSFVTPFFVAAALRRPSSWWRKVLHVAVAVFVALGWLLVSVSGYLLPGDVPNPVPRNLAPTVLRFVVLHMVGLPLLLVMALLFMGWRHLRSARQVTAVSIWHKV
ncbi:MAG: hypothetical protein ACXW3E_04015 [Thermoanaerobaculia bacterium]